MDIKGQSAIVSGGGSGLGAATARRLAARGAKVAVLDRDGAAAEAVASEIGGLALIADVTSSEEAEAAIAKAAKAHGPARILVACAGIAPGQKIVDRDGAPQPLDDFARAISVNLIGTFNLLRLLFAGAQPLEPLDGGERGVVVMTASVAAFEGQIGQAAYAASKAGVAGLTLPAAREGAKFGIRVATIAPGIFETPMLASLSETVQESLGAMVPYPPRLGRADEYAALVEHIVTNQMLNGEVIRLDGAIRMQPR